MFNPNKDNDIFPKYPFMPPNPCENFFLYNIYGRVLARKNRSISVFQTNKITLYEKVIFSCKINYNL